MAVFVYSFMWLGIVIWPLKLVSAVCGELIARFEPADASKNKHA